MLTPGKLAAGAAVELIQIRERDAAWSILSLQEATMIMDGQGLVAAAYGGQARLFEESRLGGALVNRRHPREIPR